MPLYIQQKKLKNILANLNNNIQQTNMSKNTKLTILPNELNAEHFEVTDIKTRNDRKIAYLLHNGNATYVETPKLRTPFGVSGFTPKGATRPEYSLTLSASPVGDNPEDKELNETWFQQWCLADELMQQHGLDCAETIFGAKGKKMNKDTVEALYSPVVKGKDNEEGYPLQIQPKVKRARDPEDTKKELDNVPDVEVYMEGSDKRVQIESFEQLQALIPKGSIVKAILQPNVWYIAGKFGLSLKIVQILVYKRKGGKPEGYAFSTPVKADSDEEGEAEVEEEQPDSDNEQEEEEAEEEEEEVEE